MNKSLFVSMIALVLTIGFMGCEPGADDSGRVEPKAALSNSDLENHIKAKLDSDDQIKAANLSVIADAKKKEAMLSGRVESEAVRSKAVELAKSAHSGLTVNDMIDVKPREIARKDFTEDLAKEEWEKAKQVGDQVSKRVEDAWIHAKIVAKLVGTADTPARDINVDVVRNVVTLRGKVSTAQEKSEAQRVAQETEGVERVENQLKVSA
jgi:osmotically-inducible protein OsmY